MEEPRAELCPRSLRDAADLPGLHAVLALQHGEAVLEAYFSGIDERIGSPPAPVQLGPDVAHDLRSITKTVVGLLCGVLVTERAIDVHTPLRELLPQRRSDFTPASAALTLHHVLTMSMGLEWDESFSYADPRNSEIAMALSTDRVAYVLGRPSAEPPGTRWRYCGGATELLAEVITSLSGASLVDFASERLFAPLGLRSAAWSGDPKGPYAASGLRLTARELACIGQLLLHQGSWQGRQVLPRSWLTSALRTHIAIEEGFGYGYHAYLGSVRSGERAVAYVAGIGNGGQWLYVLPELDASVAIYCGNYNDWTLTRELPGKVLREHVLPLLAAGAPQRS